MSVFGLPEQDVRELVRLVRPRVGSGVGDLANADTGTGTDSATDASGLVSDAEAFAIASWTVIAEPADEIAATVIAAIGAPAALEALISERSAEELAAEVQAVADPSVITKERLTVGLARWRPRVSARSSLLALEQAARFSCRLILPCDPEWPSGLADLDQRAPHALWARGRHGLLGTGDQAEQADQAHEAPQGLVEAVAIVGARAATGYGEHVATEFAAGLSERGVVVVSGGAYGIDGAAHRGAIAGGGTTVAILAGGLDRFYPAGHESLLRRVAAQGVLLAEVPCGTPPTRHRFLQRNRLISAIANSVVVVEAGARSGSLNTAGHAAEIGRPIGVVPGPITSAASAGCHRLLREFPSTCVTSVAEVLALFRSGLDPDTLPGFDRPPPEVLQVLDALSPRRGRATGELAQLSGLAEAEVRAVLGRLELEGTAARGAQGWVRR